MLTLYKQYIFIVIFCITPSVNTTITKSPVPKPSFRFTHIWNWKYILSSIHHNKIHLKMWTLVCFTWIHGGTHFKCEIVQSSAFLPWSHRNSTVKQTPLVEITHWEDFSLSRYLSLYAYAGLTCRVLLHIDRGVFLHYLTQILSHFGFTTFKAGTMSSSLDPVKPMYINF